MKYMKCVVNTAVLCCLRGNNIFSLTLVRCAAMLLTLEKSLELDWTCLPGWELWKWRSKISELGRWNVISFLHKHSLINPAILYMTWPQAAVSHDKLAAGEPLNTSIKSKEMICSCSPELQ